MLSLLSVYMYTKGGGTRGLTTSDIVNDDTKTARVRVDGLVNGQPFTVERTTRRSSPITSLHSLLILSSESKHIRGRCVSARAHA